MTLIDLKNALESTGVPTYHYTTTPADKRYIVWLEEGVRGGLDADDTQHESVVYGRINYVTSYEFDPMADTLIRMFGEMELSCELEMIDYNLDVAKTQYRWKFEMPYDIAEGLYGVGLS